MRILLVASGYNSMAQRVHAELADRGHEVSVELALGDEVLRDGVGRFDPDLVIAPMLTTAIPADIWSARPCFIVHPGPVGDRGPSSLDWATCAVSPGRSWPGETVAALAEQLARGPDYPARLAAKARQRAADEERRPLAAYRAAELAIMSRNFNGPPEPYAQLRRAFVYKEKPLRTPPHLARHRTRPWPTRLRRSSARETKVTLHTAIVIADGARRTTCRSPVRGARLRTPRFRRSGPNPGEACRTGRRAASGTARRRTPATRLCRPGPERRRQAGSGRPATPATLVAYLRRDHQARNP